MANKRITELTLIPEVQATDILEIVDVSDTTDSPEGTSKKVEVGSLAGNLQTVTTNGADANKTDAGLIAIDAPIFSQSANTVTDKRLIGMQNNTNADSGALYTQNAGGFQSELHAGDLTANREHKLPDESGTFATTTYVDAGLATKSTKTRIFLTSDLANSTVSDIDVTGFTFTLGASEKCDFRVCLPFTSASTTTGINVGVKVVTGVGANGNVLGNVYTKTRLSTSTIGAVTNIVDQGANATVSYSALSGVSTTGLTNVCEVDACLENLATNTSVTVQIIFASEVGASAVTLKRGATMVIEI